MAHGEPGVVHLGAEPVDLAMLQARAGLLAEWAVESIELYACNVGIDRAFGLGLAGLTGARVAVATGKDRKSTRLNSSHVSQSRMPSSA